MASGKLGVLSSAVLLLACAQLGGQKVAAAPKKATAGAEARALSGNASRREPPPAPPEPSEEGELAALGTPLSSLPIEEEGPLCVPTPIEDTSLRALDAFHSALARARAGEGQARIAFYGASHVASDLYTGLLRKQMQERFGNGGPGFVLPAKPWRWYRHTGVEIEKSFGMRSRRVMAKNPVGDAYGLSGVAFDARSDKPSSAAFTIDPRSVREDVPLQLELFYLQRANGGTVHVRVDGKHVSRKSTRAEDREQAGTAGYLRVELPLGARRVELRTDGDGPVRIFGVTLDHDAPGVVLDTLGIPGSRARYHLLWQDALYREHLAKREPDLVVLAYGTNEAGDDDVPMETYERELRQVLARVRETVPDASCLLIGPSDRPQKVDEILYTHRPRTDAIVESQRRIAMEMGCGFFDVVSFMGGPLSMVRWVDHTPPLGTPDHVHFTREGYERMGSMLLDALLPGQAPASLTEGDAHARAPLAAPEPQP